MQGNAILDYKQVIIPATVTTIRAGTFINYKKLSKVIFLPRNSDITIETNAFEINNETGLEVQFENDGLAGETIKNYFNSLATGKFKAAEYSNNIRFAQWTTKGVFEINIRYERNDQGVLTPYGIITDILDDNLDVIIIPKYIDGVRITQIGEEAFAFCSELKTLVIPDTVTEIAPLAFIDCRSLRDLVIPSRVETIGLEAFNGCVNLTNLEFTSVVPNLASKIVGAIDNLKVYGPEDDAFRKKFEDWGVSYNEGSPISAFITSTINDKTVISGIKEGFNGEWITIPSYIDGYPVTEIGDSVFMNMLNVERVEIPNSVTKIGRYAFANCVKLQEIILPSTIETIEEYAFFNCAYINSIVLPSTLSSIADGAFKDCRNLQTVEFSNLVESIGNEAFMNCIKLRSGSGDDLKLVVHFNSSQWKKLLAKYANLQIL
jgi:hypothetical protein